MSDNNRVNEEEILRFWKESGIFQKSVEARTGAPSFIFFEGPPSANAMPHIGHFETRAFKDLFCRYKTMRGYYAPRRAGWDTHGLPIEVQLEKELGFKTKQDIERFGIDTFNKRAKELVWKYKEEWNRLTHRMGFWIDLDDAYITYENNYIESLWYIIQRIWKKKLLFKDFKVVPYCARCGTALSSHEVALGYKNVTENSVYMKFKLKPQQSFGTAQDKSFSGIRADNKTYILSWTTTPWTLPGNVALAVGPRITYQVVRSKETDEKFIVAEGLTEKILDTGYEILNTVSGKELTGLEYEPLFHVPQLQNSRSHRIYPADFVSTEDGTGVVHTAVMYGQEDFELGMEHELPKFHTVTENGNFIDGLGYGLGGMYVKSKKTEDAILAHLKQEGYLLKKQAYAHDYPFCWRCNEPLLYYARNSWFVKMSRLKKELLANNKTIDWHPEHLKNGRFGEWLEGVKDWAFSRERYWGTPLPVWLCQTGKSQNPNPKFQKNSKSQISNTKTGCGNQVVIGSLEELEKLRYRKRNSYFILRHGEADSNMSDTISSHIERDASHLTEKGEKKIKDVAKRLKKEKIDVIYASDFTRTKETARIVADALNKRPTYDERLRELDCGLFDGRDISAYHDYFANDRERFSKRPPNGENLRDVKRRLISFMKEMEERYEGKNILIIGHGDPLWLLESLSKGLDEEGAMARRKDDYIATGQLKKMRFPNYPYDDNGDIDVHRPYIDNITLECKKCGGSMRRTHEVVDVWFDSGAMPFAQWHYPFENKTLIDKKKGFPADFITEAVDQTRGWFYTLLAVATLLGRGTPYKNVISVGHTLDANGEKMSKSKGNVVSPFDVMDEYGADVLRWYYYAVNPAWEPKRFSEGDLAVHRRGFFATLMNSLRFWKLYPSAKARDYHDTPSHEFSSVLDQWIVSRLNRCIKEMTGHLDAYDAMKAVRTLNEFVVTDLSNWWIRRSRARFQSGDSDAPSLLQYILLETAKLLAPCAPFTAEHLYKKLHEGTATEYAHPEQSRRTSVHLHDWPQANEAQFNDEVETKMQVVRTAVAEGLAERKRLGIKVRQPLKGAMSSIDENITMSDEYRALVQDELNVKKWSVTLDDSVEGTVFDTEITHELRLEGLMREFIRTLQGARKDAGYGYKEKASVAWYSENETVKEMIAAYRDTIIRKAILEEMIQQPDGKRVYDVEKNTELDTGMSVWIGVRKN